MFYWVVITGTTKWLHQNPWNNPTKPDKTPVPRSLLSSIWKPIIKMRPSYLYNGNFYTDKTISLYYNTPSRNHLRSLVTVTKTKGRKTQLGTYCLDYIAFLQYHLLHSLHYYMETNYYKGGHWGKLPFNAIIHRFSPSETIKHQWCEAFLIRWIQVRLIKIWCKGSL